MDPEFMPRFKSEYDEILDFAARELIEAAARLIEQEIVVEDRIDVRGVLRDLISSCDVKGDLWRRIHLNLRKEKR